MNDQSIKIRRKIRLTTESFAQRPAMDTAVSRATLQRVSEGTEPETLRLFRPGRIVAFGPQDLRVPGYPRAVAATREMGFDAISRLAGGRAALFHEGTIAFAWTIPDEMPRANVTVRFKEISEIIVDSFRRLGIDAHVGPVPGEYCPGDYSVNARNATKLMGVGQRLIGKGTHVGGVVVVNGSHVVREVLIPVYEALEVDWEPETVGSVEDELGQANYEDVRKAILAEFASRHDLYDGSLPPGVIDLAETMEQDHIAPTAEATSDQSGPR